MIASSLGREGGRVGTVCHAGASATLIGIRMGSAMRASEKMLLLPFPEIFASAAVLVAVLAISRDRAAGANFFLSLRHSPQPL